MTDEDDDEEFEPLELVPVPVSIDAHYPDVSGPSVVRLFFRAGSHDDWPGGGISDVLVIEDSDRVSIGLVRRELHGEGPDGTGYAVLLQIGGWASLDVVLSSCCRSAKQNLTGYAPEEVILDFDATPITPHSDKERAAGRHAISHAHTECAGAGPRARPLGHGVPRPSGRARPRAAHEAPTR